MTDPPDRHRIAADLAAALAGRTMHTTIEVAWLDLHADGTPVDVRRNITAVHFDMSRNVIEIVTCPGDKA